MENETEEKVEEEHKPAFKNRVQEIKFNFNKRNRGKHTPLKVDNAFRLNCRVCKQRSNIKCEECDEYIHLKCWKCWHDQEDPWS